MINLLLRLAGFAIETAVPGVSVTRAAFSFFQKQSLLRKAAVRRFRIRAGKAGRRMGILDAAVSGIQRGVSAATAEPTAPHVPTRIIPPSPLREFEERPVAPIPSPERINVPPGAYPHTPVPGNYFQSQRFTQNIYNSQYTSSPGPTPPPTKDSPTDDRLSRSYKWDVATNVFNTVYSLASSYMPRITWNGTVQATGFKTTPTRTVVHYALAVAFGLINQQRISSCALVVHIDYETNHVTVSYTSQTSLITEMVTLGIYAATGKLLPPGVVGDLTTLTRKQTDALSRSLVAGLKGGPTAGIIELGTQLIPLAGDAIKFIIKAYQNVGRLLGPLAVYDMGADTLYGGRASTLLRAPIQPEPFASMQTDKNGKPVPLLTRLPAPNPQPPVCANTDPSSGYSLDLRSLVTQALHDPGIVPPVPDTNVSLPPVF